MKLLAISLSLITGIAVNAANATTVGAPAQTTSTTPTAAAAFNPVENPALTAADERIKQAESQLDVARKQLSAAKSLLRAAEADLKAARADKQALALRTQAQDLAQEAGMQAPRSLAQVVSGPAAINTPAINNASAPVPKSSDSEPVQSFEEQAPFPNIQLR